MIARDDISENHPYLDVSIDFGCVEYKTKLG
jgi:hypothetical protein